MIKPLVIYHADCTDGFGSAFAAWLKLGDEAEYLPMQYNGPVDPRLDDPLNLGGMEIYILDFSFPKERMDFLFANAKRVVWLDHHASVVKEWGNGVFVDQRGTSTIELNDKQSGAMLAWKFFHPGTGFPRLIQHIDDRDRWQFKLEGSKELHASLASMTPWSFEQWKDLFWYEDDDYSIIDENIESLIETGAAILRAQDAHIKSMVKQARECTIRFCDDPVEFDEVGLALNTPMHMSEVGHELANQSGTFGLVWYVGADNRCKCSLRSNGDYDVSAIARAFGGGGHRNAAGFETDIETLMGWLK